MISECLYTHKKQGFDFHNNSENSQQIIGIKFLNNIFLGNHILKDKIKSFEKSFQETNIIWESTLSKAQYYHKIDPKYIRNFDSRQTLENL